MSDIMQRRSSACSSRPSATRHRIGPVPLLPHLTTDPRTFAREQHLTARHPTAAAAAPYPGKHHAARLAPGAALPAAAAASPTLPGVEGSLTVQCKVVVPYHPTHHGQQLVLVGGCDTLGNWDVKKGVKFTWCEGHSHVAEAELPVHTSVACKLVVLGPGNTAAWEPEANRELLLAPSSLASRAAGYTVLCHWGFPDCTQVVANALRRGNISSSYTPGSAPGIANGRPANGHHFRAGGVDNPIIAGVKKALAQASSKVLPGIASWEEEAPEAHEPEEEDTLVQCQVTVLVPRSGPKLKPEQSLVLVGSSPALGRWDPAHGLPLDRAGEESAMWTAHVELPLGDGLQAKVVVVDSVSGQAQTWEPCENRSMACHRGPKPVMVTAYWGVPNTFSLEVDRLSSAAAATNPQVVQLLRQQLAATSSQLDGLRRERDDARKAMVTSEETMKQLEAETRSQSTDRTQGRFEMVQLAQQLQTTRQLYEATKKEATELGGSVGVTRKLCDAAKRELSGLAHQLESAKRAYEALAPEVERMEKKLAATTRAFDATKPELVALEAQLERARSLFDRTLQKIEAAKSLTASGEYDAHVVRRRTENRIRDLQFAKF